MANEKRLIDADALMAELEERQAFLVKEYGCRDHYTRGFVEAVDKVSDAPTVDAVEVVHGSWNIINFCSGDTAICSVCGCEMLVNEPGNGLHNVEDLHYCPNCGADMRVGDGNG